MSRPVTLFTGQWADLPLRGACREGRAPGASTGSSSRAGAITSRSIGRSRTTATATTRRELLERTAWRAGRSARTSSGRRSATRSTTRHRGILPPEVWGDGEPEGVRQRAAERMKDTARAAAQARRDAGQRVHRLGDLAPALLVPAERLRRDRARLRGVRRALGPDPRRLRRGGRAVRARGPSDRDRLRLRHDAEGARRDRRTARRSASTSTRATSRTSSSTRPQFALEFARPHLPRPREGRRSGGSTGGARSSART